MKPQAINPLLDQLEKINAEMKDLNERKKALLDRQAIDKQDYIKSLEWAINQPAIFSAKDDLMYGLQYKLSFNATNDVCDGLGFAGSIVIRGNSNFQHENVVLSRDQEFRAVHLATHNVKLFCEILEEIQPAIRELPRYVEEVIEVGLSVLNYVERN